MTVKSPSWNRRRFLGATVGGGAALALSPRLPPASALGANDRIRIGVAGTGGRARHLMRLLKELLGCEIVAVSDVYEPRMVEAAEIAGPGALKHADYRRILDDKDVHAVLVGSPDHWHLKMTADALAAGKDVYLEKPISHTLEEGDAFLKLVEGSKQVVQTGTQQRSWEHFGLGKQIVDSGKLGQVTFVHTYWHQRMGLGPWAEVDQAKLDWKSWLGPAPDQPWSPERFFRWRHFRDFGGGVLTDLLTHWIDVVHWYLGVTAPLAAVVTSAKYRVKYIDWPDTVTATLEYPKDFMVTHTGTYASSIDDGGLEFRGDEATLKVDRERLAVFSEASRKGQPWRHTPEPEILVRSLGDGTAAHLANWLDCIRSRKTPSAPVRVGVEAARAAHIANQSLLAGARVRWNAAAGRVERA
ncbi:MAG TPA: Gfo/Idh/MocA family oxidoreductase [Vicinamibacteria bacterium]|nr:Gfo/Idh/MocA family oxidoreductase [Vicinamibacteria bacterium]